MWLLVLIVMSGKGAPYLAHLDTFTTQQACEATMLKIQGHAQVTGEGLQPYECLHVRR